MRCCSGLARRPAARCAFVDGSYIKLHQHGLQGAAALRAQEAIGLSRGGWTTKAVAVVDEAGLLCGVLLAPGNQHDQTASRALLPALAGGHFVGDKGFDSEAFRTALREAGVMQMTIPRRGYQTIAEQPAPFDDAVYRQRHKVENIFQRLKLHKRIALRSDKTASSFMGFLVFAALLDRLAICKDTA
jgi:transposase